jgi:hypothetical protein
MATAYTIVRRALRLVRVIDAAEAVPALEAQDTFAALNGLLAEWHEAQIRLPDYSFASLETELASDVADEDAIAYQLAKRIAPEYGKQLSAQANESANESFSRLRLRYFQPGTTNFDELPTGNLAFNIETGE